MGVDQTVPLLGGIHFDAPISTRVIRVVLSAWIRDHRLVHPIPDPTLVRTSPEYQRWLMTDVWPVERLRRIALLRQVEGWDREEDEVSTSRATASGVAFEAAEERDDSPERECAPRRRRVV